MLAKGAKILILFDLLESHATQADYSSLLQHEDLEVVREAAKCLMDAGYAVLFHGLYNDLNALLVMLQAVQPDIVLNLCEAFNAQREFEPHLVSLLELMGIAYTGAGSFALRLCKDKGLTKKILSYHDIRIPRFVVSPRTKPVRRLPRFPFPAIVKPLGLEASEGIAQLSLVQSEQEFLERQQYLHEKLATDVIVEEFIDGREIYVAVLGNERLTCFPARELVFEKLEEGERYFATYRAKWDSQYRRRWGVKTVMSEALSSATMRQLERQSKRIYRLFELQGYCRFDYRLENATGELVFIEANPNPALGPEDDFALAAKHAGLEFPALLERILALGVALKKTS
jgi:D-alanine-D-alanine ligase